MARSSPMSSLRVILVVAVLAAGLPVHLGFLIPWSLGRHFAARMRGQSPAHSSAVSLYQRPSSSRYQKPSSSHYQKPSTSLYQRPSDFKALRLPTEARLNAMQLIQRAGYPAEAHRVQTEDGYILTMHRIPHGPNNPPARGEAARPVVFMQHGILQTSDQWLLRGPGQDLAFILADRGYDVWMGNFRGNTYSRRHKSYSPDTQRFWDFSWHENGYYDLPAMMVFALQTTGNQKLHYIGHSMGTTTLLVLLSSRPQFNEKVRLATLLAPVVYFTRPQGLNGVALPAYAGLERDLRSIRSEILPRNPFTMMIATALCAEGSATHHLCVKGYFELSGFDYKEFNSTLFSVIVNHIPAGSSLGQFTHYVQVYKSGQFRRFNHGPRENMYHYGQTDPPKYDLNNVVAPIAWHYSTGDFFSAAKDVEKASQEVPGTVGLYKVPLPEFNHGDYLWATDSYELLYKTVISVMEQY